MNKISIDYKSQNCYFCRLNRMCQIKIIFKVILTLYYVLFKVLENYILANLILYQNDNVKL